MGLDLFLISYIIVPMSPSPSDQSMWDLRRKPVVSPTPQQNLRAELKARLEQLREESGTSDEPDDSLCLRIRQLRGEPS